MNKFAMILGLAVCLSASAFADETAAPAASAPAANMDAPAASAPAATTTTGKMKSHKGKRGWKKGKKSKDSMNQ